MSNSRPLRGKERAPRRFAGIFELEDLLLALWMLAVEQLLVRRYGLSPAGWTEPGEGGSLTWPLAGMLVAAAFVIFTRGSLDVSIDQAVKRRTLISLPLFFILPLIASVASLIRGGEKSIARHGGEQAEWPFPAAPDWLRRLVATPILLTGDSIFLAAFEAEQSSFLAPEGGPTFAGAATTFFLIAIPFLIFVAGPRIAAGSTGDWKVWLGRFAFYAVLLVTGQELAGSGAF